MSLEDRLPRYNLKYIIDNYVCYEQTKTKVKFTLLGGDTVEIPLNYIVSFLDRLDKELAEAEQAIRERLALLQMGSSSVLH